MTTEPTHGVFRDPDGYGRMSASLGRANISPMTINVPPEAHLAAEDRRLVDMLETVLVDPNLHTDTRMRLHTEIDEILRGVHDDLHGPAGQEVHARKLEAHDGHLPEVLASVLVDPNLHTDTRLRVHHQIAEILSAAQRTGRG